MRRIELQVSPRQLECRIPMFENTPGTLPKWLSPTQAKVVGASILCHKKGGEARVHYARAVPLHRANLQQAARRAPVLATARVNDLGTH